MSFKEIYAETYQKLHKLEGRLIDNYSIVLVGQPLHWLYCAIVFDCQCNLRLVPYLEQKMKECEPGFRDEFRDTLNCAIIAQHKADSVA